MMHLTDGYLGEGANVFVDGEVTAGQRMPIQGGGVRVDAIIEEVGFAEDGFGQPGTLWAANLMVGKSRYSMLRKVVRPEGSRWLLQEDYLVIAPNKVSS